MSERVGYDASHIDDYSGILEAAPFSSELQTEVGNPDMPVFQRRAEIVDAVDNNQVVIVVAETGAGKSTGVPQFLMAAGYDVHLSQPRRLAAKEVFARIDYELRTMLGEEHGSNLVSFQTAAGRTGPADARIKVVTDGLELVKELGNGDLDESVVHVLDEVHEENANIEFLRADAKRKIAADPTYKLVIMSATMHAQGYADYFADICDEVPIIEVKGKPHQLTIIEKPESTVVNEILSTAKHIYEVGREPREEDEPAPLNGILVFEPGKQEINDTIDAVLRQLPPEVAKVAHVIGLHAKMTPAEQQKAIASYPGVKIVVATDVAQTSLTIPDIACVIDSGYQRRQELDEDGIQGLMLRPISRADCLQRAGRTGRVAPGTYILTKMHAEASFTGLEDERRDKYPVPEILRTDLDRHILRLASIDTDIEDLDLYHPVPSPAIIRAKHNLNLLGALDDHGKITDVGRRMNEFPICPSSARMMVSADLAPERIRAYLSAIVAIREQGGLRQFGPDVGRRWEDFTDESSSDLLAELDIFLAIQDVPERYLAQYDIDRNSLDRAQELFRKVARRSHVDPDLGLPDPNHDERAELRRLIRTGYAHAIFLPIGDGKYQQLGGSVVEREISNRSMAVNTRQPVVGEPRRVEIRRRGSVEIKQIIEGVTEISMAEIGALAVRMTEWAPDSYTLRGGKFMQREVQRLGRFALDSREVPAVASPKLRAAIIEHVTARPGPTLRYLYGIKKELEKLAHKTKIPIPRLTESQIQGLIRHAAPEDITDPSLIDNNLRELVVQQAISKETFVAPDLEERIIAAAPATFTFGGQNLRLSYQQGNVTTKIVDDRVPVAWLANLEDSPRLPDGREIFFRYLGKRYNLLQLRRKLFEEGII